jgi:YgiT-type zinc finger domain-containing protein
MVSKCFLCGSGTIKKYITAENWWGEQLTLIENVPAWVCENCGEQYFDAEVIEELDRLKESPSKAERTILVPIFKFPRGGNSVGTDPKF